MPAMNQMAISVDVPVIASGGVSCCQDILDLARLHAANLEGIIVGKALYTGDLSLTEALKLVKDEGQAL